MKDIEGQLYKFISNFGEDLCSLELLLFFARHPNARFNRTAVINALTARQFDSGISLKRLIGKKLVVTFSENGIILYGLTKDEELHRLVLELVNIDQGQWQIILEQILQAQGII